MADTGPDEEGTRILFTFGDFALDPDRATLHKSGRIRRLRPQSYEVLRYLVEHHGTLVSKKDLIDYVWHGGPVSEDSVTQCLIDIRKALGDDSKSIIRTVPRRGFIFELPVLRQVRDRDDHEGRYRNGLSRHGWIGATLLLVVLAGAAYLASTNRNASELADARYPDNGVRSPKTSIAVLPFADTSDEAKWQYAVDGISDSIINRLDQSPDIRVIAWNSSFLASQLSSDSIGIGDRLNVDYVLQGSIHRSLDKVLVEVQLQETDSGKPVWADKFERSLTAAYLFELQFELADAVAGAIGARLPARETNRASGYRPRSTEALDHFQQGMFFLRQIETGIARNYDAGVAHFEQALSIEPDWPAAHAALGRVLHFRASVLAESQGEPWFRQSKEHLLRAIELDPDYGPAHASLGFVLHNWELDFEAAAAAYQRAMELGVTQYWGLAIFLLSTAEFDAAVETYRRALDRDPLSLGLKNQLATALYCAGRYAESIEHRERLLETNPQSEADLAWLAFLYLKTGETEKSAAILENHPGILGRPGSVAHLYAIMGRYEEAEEQIDIAEADPAWRPLDVVPAALLLGQKERALGYLEQVAAQAPRALRFIRCEEEVRALAGEPRYERVLDTVGFPKRGQ